jgi:hypothetical protein
MIDVITFLMYVYVERDWKIKTTCNSKWSLPHGIVKISIEFWTD